MNKYNTLLLIAAVWTVSSTYCWSQKTIYDTYAEEIQAATTPVDTMMSILTLKNSIPVDEISRLETALRETMSGQYPLFNDLFMQLAINGDTTGMSEMVPSLLKSNYPEVYKDYARLIMLIRDLRSGKTEAILDEKLAYKYDSRSAQALRLVYDLNINMSNRNLDALIENSYRLIDVLSPDLYPLMQLGTVENIVRYKRGNIDSVDIVLIEDILQKGQMQDHYTYKINLLTYAAQYYKNRNEVSKYMDAGYKAIEVSESVRDTSLMIMNYSNAATFHHEIGQFDTAYDLLDRARQCAADDTTQLIMVYAGTAFAKMNEEKYEDALDLLKVAVYNPTYISGNRLSLILLNIIEAHHAISQYDSAYVYYKKLVDHDPEDRADMQNYAKTFVAKHLLQSGEYDLAKQYTDEAYEVALASGDKTAESIALAMKSDLVATKGDYAQALDYYKQYVDIKLDFRAADRATETTQTRLSYEYEKEKALTALKNEQETALLKARQRQTALVGGLAALGLAMMLLLYRSIKKKNKQIERQNTKLQELNTTKDTLFQIIGHDLKKPTIGFRNISKNINYLLDKGDYKRLQALGKEVDQDAKSLYMLTDNLLNWATVQKNAITLRPTRVDLHELVNSNLELFANVAQRKNVQLVNEVRENTILTVDKNSIDTVIRNLIDNAIKYTDQGGSVTIRSDIKQGMTTIEIRDTGIGVSQAVITSVTEDTGVTSTAGTEGEQGSGIGLQLVKRLVAKNNGRFSLTRQRERGTLATISIPSAG